MPVRAPADQARRPRPRRRPRSRRSSTRRWPPRSRRTRARRSSTSRSTSCSWRRRARASPSARWPDAVRGRPGARRRARGGAAARRRAPGDHGRHEPLLGPRRGRAASRSRRSCGIPVFLNGLARGCVPADHELFFSRARSNGLKGADVALVIGVPMDFRLGFGQSFGEETEIVVIDRAEPLREHPRAGGRRALRRRSPATLDALRSEAARRRGHGRVGRARCARPRTRSARPSAPSSTTTARRCTRCASTASSARCSTATRS